MSQDEGDGTDGIAGLSLSDAVDTVVARDDTPDRETVRSVLATVTEDGVVRQDAIDSALADASMAVSNAESRAEMAAVALADVRKLLPDVPELDAVQARVDAFEADVAAVEERASDLGASLQDLVARKDEPAALYDVAAGIDRLTRDAGTVHATADELQTDLESFEQWLTDADYRRRELDRDVDVIEQSLATLDENVDELATIATGDRDQSVTADELAATWLDLAVSHRVRELGLADARAELADLRTWAADASVDEAYGDDIEARLDDLDEQWATLEEQLAEIAEPAWRDRFDERLNAIETTLDGFEPPIDFSAVQAALEEHRLE